MTRSVEDTTVNDQMDADSLTRSVKNTTVNDRVDTNSVNSSMKHTTVNYPVDVISMTPPIKHITVALPSNVTLLTVPLGLLYHMIWCIQVDLVKHPPVWPYADQYRKCRSPILSTWSKVMTFTPRLNWMNDHKNTQVTVERSLLSDIVWCSLHELDRDFMLFSFDNLLKLCEKKHTSC